MGNKATAITEEEAREYIRLVALGVPKTDAGKMVGRTAPTLGAFINKDPDLKEALAQAWRDSAEPLIEEAVRRGKEGWLEPIVQGGKHVVGLDGQPLYKHVYDSNHLMFVIKERRPEFRESSQPEINIQVGMKFEDRSAAIGEMVKVLEQAGVEAAAIGSRTAPKELPSSTGVLAESPDLQPEASSVPRSS